MYCNNCGTKINNNSIFCNVCGNKITDIGFDFNYLSDNFIYIRNQNHYIGTLKRCITILNDCQDLINNTKNPKVFFKRYLLAISILNELILVQNQYQKAFIGNKPSDIKSQLMKKEIYTVNDFLDRYYDDTIYQINQLKTIKSKQNKVDKFCNGLNEYKKYMRLSSINKYNNLCINLKTKYKK